MLVIVSPSSRTIWRRCQNASLMGPGAESVKGGGRKRSISFRTTRHLFYVVLA